LFGSFSFVFIAGQSSDIAWYSGEFQVTTMWVVFSPIQIVCYNENQKTRSEFELDLDELNCYCVLTEVLLHLLYLLCLSILYVGQMWHQRKNWCPTDDRMGYQIDPTNICIANILYANMYF